MVRLFGVPICDGPVWRPRHNVASIVLIGGLWLTSLAAAETVEFTVSSHNGVRFEKDDVVFYERGGGGGGGRGFTVVVVDPRSETGNVTAVRTFDTWLLHCSEHDALVAFLDSFPIGTLFLIAVGDEAGLVNDDCSERTRRAMEALASTKIRSYRFRNRWILITVKGERAPIQEELSASTVVVDRQLNFPLADPTPSSRRALWCGSPDNAPPFDPIDITMMDANGNDLATVTALRPTTVCAPLGMNTRTEPPSTTDSWIVCYDLAGLSVSPPVTVRVQTALALRSHTLQIDSVHSVCIPGRPVN